MSAIKSLDALKGCRFKYRGKIYCVKDTEVRFGKNKIQTDLRAFVWDDVQLEDFINEITDLKPITEAVQRPPGCNETNNKQNTIMAQSESIAVMNASVASADAMNLKLMDMFNILSENPTEADFKKAEAMSKIVNTVISVEQTKINYLKLKSQQ